MVATFVPQPLTRRLFALGLLGLFLGAQVSAGLHYALVAHETCEHGDIVHADGEHSALGAVRVDVDALTAHNEEAPHVHCGEPLVEPLTATSPANTALNTTHATGIDGLDAVAPKSWVAANRAVFRTAPKQSPPA